MDEAIWAAIGVISAVLGIGIIITLLVQNSAEIDFAQAEAGVQVLAAQCEQVCALPENTAISVKVQLPSGIILITDKERICAESTQDDQIACTRCDCTHGTPKTVLNLSDTSFFSSHTFACRYERIETQNTRREVALNCAG